MNKSADYFAELYVAGKFADAGWNVYFPHRDKGFDFIISKDCQGEIVILPVQVKGKFPTELKTDKPVYGYVGRLSQTHPELVLAIAYFNRSEASLTPSRVAYMPFACVKKHKRGYRCQPAMFRKTIAVPRRDFAKFFDDKGLELLESSRPKP